MSHLCTLTNSTSSLSCSFVLSHLQSGSVITNHPLPLNTHRLIIIITIHLYVELVLCYSQFCTRFLHITIVFHCQCCQMFSHREMLCCLYNVNIVMTYFLSLYYRELTHYSSLFLMVNFKTINNCLIIV